MIFLTFQHLIDDQALTVRPADGVPLNIRPKTCQLLLLLIKSAGKPINKQQLLDTVWVDTVVSEQVVFQSINEIRQLFPNAEVIKTIPKQGYVWLPDVEVQVPEEKAKTVKPEAKKINRTSLSFILALIISLLLIVIWQLPNITQASGNKVSGSVIVLPTQNLIAGNGHNWVRLGLMDQVIQQLPNAKSHGVLQTDYVLEVLKRANAPLNDLLAEHIQQVFQVSGAELVVASKLAGVPHDYQLSYVFHYRNNFKKGVLFNKNMQPLIDEFASLIARQLGENVRPTDITAQSDFNNELLGEAIEQRLKGNYELAKPLLESIVVSNPENLTAQRLLAGNLFRLKQHEQAFERIEMVLPVAKTLNDQEELTRLLYLKALFQYATFDDKSAEKTVQQAMSVAKQNNDWLLMAYISNIRANLAVNRKAFNEAERFYQEEMSYHKVLRCPVGEAQSWGYLARLAKWQNQPKKFDTAIEKAINIAETRGLTSQLEYFSNLKSQKNNE